ncbi:hypothetical protein CR205_16515 [Alteribacter lacisalsi]|uniref:Uncharacterized protein n=1 Tax=Alteribacter lacisalsi TaxID=2045244 RepID=A0A2W0H486_9BACI|nr:hypothetical protein [Alteribacter lacisalsi]PYZ95977.1 hypothetical protein CR205_16515 [Alteribacter lacisalsi]
MLKKTGKMSKIKQITLFRPLYKLPNGSCLKEPERGYAVKVFTGSLRGYWLKAKKGSGVLPAGRLTPRVFIGKQMKNPHFFLSLLHLSYNKALALENNLLSPAASFTFFYSHKLTENSFLLSSFRKDCCY